MRHNRLVSNTVQYTNITAFVATGCLSKFRIGPFLQALWTRVWPLRFGSNLTKLHLTYKRFGTLLNTQNLFGHPVLPLQLWYPKRLDMSHYSILHPLKIWRFFYWLYSSSARIRGHSGLRYGCLAGPSILQPLQPHPRWMPSFGIFDARTYITKK